MKRTAEKRQYYIHLVQCRDVPSKDGEVALKWKRGKKKTNKGVLKQLKCVSGTVEGNLFNVIMPQCTLFKTAKGYEEKLMKLSLLSYKDEKKKKLDVIGYCYIDLSNYVECSQRKNVILEMKVKKGKPFECEIDVQCLGGMEVSENDKTEVFSGSKSGNPFGEEDSDIEISEDPVDPKRSFRKEKPTKAALKKKELSLNIPQKMKVSPKPSPNVDTKSNPFSDDEAKEKKEIAKESNPFSDDDDKETLNVVVQPKAQVADKNPFSDGDSEETPKNPSKDTSANPFSDEDDVDIRPVVSTNENANPFSDEDSEEAPKNPSKDTSANPFSDEDDVDIQPVVSIKSNANANPFSDEDSDDDIVPNTKVTQTQIQVKGNDNPFGDDDSEDIQVIQNKSTTVANPFGDSEESEEVVSNNKVNDNPFGDEEESEEISNEATTNIFLSSKPTEKIVEEPPKPKEEQIPIIQYKKNGGAIDLREVFDSVKGLKGRHDDLDNFIILMKKWWSDGKPHMELNVLPMIMDDYQECIWLLIGLKDLGGKIRRPQDKMTQRDIQINEIYENTYIRAVKFISSRMEGLLDYLVSVSVFDSRRSTFEEGVAIGTVEIMNEIYQNSNKFDASIGDRLLKQTCHFISYYVIEEMIKRNKVNGMKGFEMNYYVSCIQNEVCKNHAHLKKYMKYLDPLLEICRLLTMPMCLDIIKMKDEIFPSLPCALMGRVLGLFRIDSYNLTRIPRNVFDYLFEHNDNKATPSRFDILK